ncbi:thioredoxin domain-containing protein [Alkalibacterium olivapovliticus]|uniref:Thioredoxin-like protein n=1 Tax=Alkalibacterium olivapovliticus TaxID=99907 RepID=A0A2T0W7D6_9LACT|nr:thioredoxin domain-containing protein [Alkalibacterium olivapovliticus]PRY82621.1 thioredoxin-like protein [Alkalibacterium olivapovliticus]
MDTRNINADAISTEGGFHFGDKDAPIKVIEFINLKCPYCKEWWEKGSPVLDKYVKDHKVERIVKLFDKEKPSLRKGNVLHAHLDYNDLDSVRKDIDYYVEHLDDWGNLSDEQVAEYAQTQRNADKQDNQAFSEAILTEAETANVKFVPTVFIEDYIFDEHITEEELEKIIETKLKRDEDREPNTF